MKFRRRFTLGSQHLWPECGQGQLGSDERRFACLLGAGRVLLQDDEAHIEREAGEVLGLRWGVEAEEVSLEKEASSLGSEKEKELLEKENMK